MSEKYQPDLVDSDEEDIDAQLAREFGANQNRSRSTAVDASTALANMTGLVALKAKAVSAAQLSTRHHIAKQKAVEIFRNKRLLRMENPDLFQIKGQVLVCLLDGISDDTGATEALGGFIEVIYRLGDDYYGLVDTFG